MANMAEMEAMVENKDIDGIISILNGGDPLEMWVMLTVLDKCPEVAEKVGIVTSFSKVSEMFDQIKDMDNVFNLSDEELKQLVEAASEEECIATLRTVTQELVHRKDAEDFLLRTKDAERIPKLAALVHMIEERFPGLCDRATVMRADRVVVSRYVAESYGYTAQSLVNAGMSWDNIQKVNSYCTEIKITNEKIERLKSEQPELFEGVDMDKAKEVKRIDPTLRLCNLHTLEPGEVFDPDHEY